MESLYDRLIQRTPKVGVTKLLVSINILVFVAMLMSGAGFWHSPNDIQLDWGANFGPATQDGEWWRLFTAMFLHFGAMHLALNSFALWDGGLLVERMYGYWRFIAIYLISGLMGNLLSLVVQGNLAVSGGASGAIFGIYGAAFVFLWRERAAMSAREFRWVFGGGLAFSALTIVMGFIIPGIDNAAHIGGLITGALCGIVFSQTITARYMPRKYTAAAVGMLMFATILLIQLIPAPKYRWSDELLLRSQINAFLSQDQAIHRSWLEIVQEGKQGVSSFDTLAGKIDDTISEPYAESFEKLSKLPHDPNLPSAMQLENILRYAEKRQAESKAMAEKLREQPFGNSLKRNQFAPSD